MKLSKKIENDKISRREFLGSVGAATIVLNIGGISNLSASEEQGTVGSRKILTTFEYSGVQLSSSRWQEQYTLAQNFYLGISNDDILYGFRKAAGLPAPGKPLGGWCKTNSSTVFGQWLSGLSRMYHTTGNIALKDKAVELMNEWGKTIGSDGNCHMGHYPYDKIVCGLVDMKKYAGISEAIPLLDKITNWSISNLNRDRIPAVSTPINLNSGKPGEWYTLSENLYRAFELTGDQKYKSFAEIWHYPQYWDKFAETAVPTDAFGVHAYSHVNTFSSAAMAYFVTGDPKYLNCMKNFYDFMQNTQCFATGGYGPVERIMPLNGSLGHSLEYRSNTFETGCGSWAGFKLSSYLMQFTGEARYGDWIERLLYNGIGAALPVTTGGKNFYYSDYRVSSGMKVYMWLPDHAFTCCSGTYLQNMAEYINMIYFKDDSSLYVNLYIPSEITWKHKDGEIKVVQETAYPETDLIKLKLELTNNIRFSLKFRIPFWAHNASLKVNGLSIASECNPGTWAIIERNWKNGDYVDLQIPLRFRMVPIDLQHPKRVAVVRGPLAMVMDAHNHDSFPKLPMDEDELNQLLVAEGTSAVFRIQPSDGTHPQPKLYPFYKAGEGLPYSMYHDLDKLPVGMWQD